MTTKELNKLILESPHSELLNNFTFNINFLSGTVKFVGLQKIYDFVIRENSAWESLTVKLSVLQYNLAFYNNFKQGLLNFIGYINQNINENRLQNYWQAYVSTSHNITSYNKNILEYSSPEATFLFKIYSDYNQNNTIIQGVFEMLTNNLDREKGRILGYEFISTESVISERRRSEQKHLNKLRTEYENELASARTNLIEHIKEANKKTSEFAKAITDLKTEKETSFDKWFEASGLKFLEFQGVEQAKLESWAEEKQEEYNNFINSSTTQIADLERTYKEKLSLEAPVTYWNKRATEMNRRGNWALGGLIALIVLSVIILATFFFNAPIDALQKLLAGEAYGIKWMLTSITIISFLAYGMRSLNKLMFSSYHLARDAEERRKLTYVYLALKEQGAVDKEDRHIVLQSLFSRAETGLLKDESSPTMPSTLMDKFTTK